MSRYRLDLVVFLAGLAAACSIAASYVGSNLLALAVTLLILTCYLIGALELRRYSQATGTLSRALAGLSAPPPSLAGWLDTLHPSLRNAARLRIEGERVGLPGPALSSYLVGLLVLLGMLGTLLGMVATLRGTGVALESASDLQAIRASLAAPVKGLGFAFGTSIAGVATSAMLGLLSALYRRERLDAAQLLDAKIATQLRVYSQSHQRDESFRLLQRQAEMMPMLVDRLQMMTAALEQQSLAAHERQLDQQDAFHRKTESAYLRLANSVERSLKDSVADSARAASAALQPVMEAAMSGLARETTALHDTVKQAVERQLDGLSSGFDATATRVAGIWNDALDAQRHANDALAGELRVSLAAVAERFEQRSAALVDGVSARLDATAGSLSQAWGDALAQQQRVGDALAANNEQALAAATAAFAQQTQALVRTLGESHDEWQTAFASRDEQRVAAWREALASMVAELNEQWTQTGAQTAERQQQICDTLAQTARDIAAQGEVHARAAIGEIERLVEAASEAPKAAAHLHEQIAARDEQRVAAWTESLASMVATLNAQWTQAGAQTAERQQQICDTLAQTARDIAAQGEVHARATIGEIERLVHAASEAPKAAAHLHEQIAARDEQRVAAWTESLASIVATLNAQWEQTGARTAERQQQVCDTLAQTARDIAAQSEVHARATIGEIERLVEAASEAPKAAAEVVAELRQKLSDSMVRDNAMLDERSRLLATLDTLLDAVNHASSEQRTAVDALVATSADLLERVGTRFTAHVEAQTGKLGAVAAQVTGSAVEVASMGEAFGAAVQTFGESNDKLMAQLQRIESALDKSAARSDEQLAYYVAQAREVVDLSVLSQKQIVEELQLLASRHASAGADQP